MGRGASRITARRLALVLGVLVPVVLVAWALLARPVAVPFVGTDLDDMVAVPGGGFSSAGRTFEVEAYWIDRFEVTERDWAVYAAASGAAPLAMPAGMPRNPDFPARFVSCAEAEAYAVFHLKRLPTNLEWERASQGPGGSALPWGDAYLAAANTQEAWVGRGYLDWGVTRVGTFERGRSEAGCYDMIGNVWEWTASDWHEALRLRLLGDPIPEPSPALRGSPRFPREFRRSLPWQWSREDWRQLRALLLGGEDGAEGPGPAGRIARFRPESSYRGMRLVRGASFKSPIRGSAPEVERLEAEDTKSWDIGFRCVVSDEEVEFQKRLRDRIGDLGWNDPVHMLLAVLPAERAIEAMGPRVLPHLARTRDRSTDDTLRARLDRLIETIGRRP